MECHGDRDSDGDLAQLEIFSSCDSPLEWFLAGRLSERISERSIMQYETERGEDGVQRLKGGAIAIVDPGTPPSALARAS